MKEVKMILESNYYETIKKVAEFKLSLINEEINQKEILESEPSYTPDFTKNIQNLVIKMHEIFDASSNLYHNNLEETFYQYHDFMNYDMLQDRIQYQLDKYLPKLQGLTLNNDTYYIMDDIYSDIEVVDLDKLFTFYDTICELLINDFMCYIENLDDVDTKGLRLENQVLSYNHNNGNGWYNLVFDNGSYLQSETIHAQKFQNPLFSALIAKFIKEII